MKKNPVKTLIIARKNSRENPSVNVLSWFTIVGAKWLRLTNTKRIKKNTSDSTLKIVEKVEIEEDGVPYTLV
jgi:hypothetical protein